MVKQSSAIEALNYLDSRTNQLEGHFAIRSAIDKLREYINQQGKDDTNEVNQNKENCCKNCDNADNYGFSEGFYCNEKQCYFRGEQYECQMFHCE